MLLALVVTVTVGGGTLDRCGALIDDLDAIFEERRIELIQSGYIGFDIRDAAMISSERRKPWSLPLAIRNALIRALSPTFTYHRSRTGPDWAEWLTPMHLLVL